MQMTNGCRLCSSTDDDALIESLATDLWQSWADEAGSSQPRAEAAAFWQERFRELARTAIESLRS